MWGGGRGFSGAMQQMTFWIVLIIFWLLCLGASTVEAQALPVGMDLLTVWPSILQTLTVGGATVAVIVRIDEAQKQRLKDMDRVESMVREIKVDLKEIRSEMFTRREVEEARRTADAEHKAFDHRITALEEA